MARKFTTFVHSNDPEAKRIISENAPNIKFVQFSYIRDDRIVELDTGNVYIGSHNESTYQNTIHIHHDSGEIASDAIRNCYLDNNNCIIGKHVVMNLDDKDSKIHLDVEECVLANIDEGYFRFKSMNIEAFLEEFKMIPGCEWIYDELLLIYNHYKLPHSSEWYLRMWHMINRYNLFDMIDQYSNLFTYYEDFYVRGQLGSFFEVADIPEEFLFRLTNYYICPREGRYNAVTSLTKSGKMWKLFSNIPNDCKTVFLEEAEKERFDILQPDFSSTDIFNIVAIANDHPEFFKDYLQKVDTKRIRGDIFMGMLSDFRTLSSNNLSIEFENIAKSVLSSKAKSIGVDLPEYLDLISNLNTKEGLIKYLISTKNNNQE